MVANGWLFIFLGCLHFCPVVLDKVPLQVAGLVFTRTLVKRIYWIENPTTFSIRRVPSSKSPPKAGRRHGLLRASQCFKKFAWLCGGSCILFVALAFKPAIGLKQVLVVLVLLGGCLCSQLKFCTSRQPLIILFLACKEEDHGTFGSFDWSPLAKALFRLIWESASSSQDKVLVVFRHSI